MFNGMTREDLTKMGMFPPDYLCPTISTKLSDPRAAPARANPTDAGADLFSVNKHVIYPNEMHMVDTGVSVKIPLGYVGLVYSRSGMGKLRISLANSVGVIDSDYRGLIKVMIVNEGDDPYEIHPFITKIAQLVVTPIILPRFVVSQESDEKWLNTSRGANGFGSTN